MRSVILAAGKGVRLGGRGLPKPLTRLASGRTILEMQLDLLSDYMPLGLITIVIGYRKELFIDYISQVSFVENNSYSEENTSKSLLKGIEGLDDDLLWLNGDVVFKKKVLEKLIARQGNAMIVNRAEVGQEEVKYRIDHEGKIIEVSKNINNPQGEAVGINLFKRKDLPLLRKELSACSPSDYFEKGVERCIACGVSVYPVLVDWNECIEIDFPEDLEKVNSLFF